VDPASLDITLLRVKSAEAFDWATLQIANVLQTFLLFVSYIKAALDIGGAR
jgi:hypothetical protein